MTTKEESKNPYERKSFYIIKEHVNDEGLPCKLLIGPRDDIYFCVLSDKMNGEEIGGYKYCQVIDGKIMQAFRENEILVTDRVL
jgi:hypothetical protein